MLRPEVFYDILDIISDDCFYSEKHRLVFGAMTDLFAKKNLLIYLPCLLY